MRNLAQESTENRRRSGYEGAAQLRGPQLRVAAESMRGPMKKMLPNQGEAHVPAAVSRQAAGYAPSAVRVGEDDPPSIYLAV